MKGDNSKVDRRWNQPKSQITCHTGQFKMPGGGKLA